jgi:hypothetical protein
MQLVYEFPGLRSHANDEFDGTYHSREELAAEPCTTTGADRLLDDGDLHGRVLAELVGTREPRGSRAHHHDVGVGVRDHVHHVPPGHLAGHDGLLDGIERERFQIVRRRGSAGHGDRGFSPSLGGLNADGRWGQRGAMEGGGGVFEKSEPLGFGGEGGGHGRHCYQP